MLHSNAYTIDKLKVTYNSTGFDLCNNLVS